MRNATPRSPRRRRRCRWQAAESKGELSRLFSRFVKSPDYFRDFCRLFRRPHFSCYFSRANSRFVFIDSSSTNSALSVVSFFRFFFSHFHALFRIFKLLFVYLSPLLHPQACGAPFSRAASFDILTLIVPWIFRFRIISRIAYFIRGAPKFAIMHNWDIYASQSVKVQEKLSK